MTQLIINGTEYPWVDNGNYTAHRETLGESKRSITGKLFTQVRGSYAVIEYGYDYFYDDMYFDCMESLGSGDDLLVSYLDPQTNAMTSGVFRCTRVPQPTVLMDYMGRGIWHDISFRLEEIEEGA